MTAQLAPDVDQQLVERVQKGDKRAFDLLVIKYQHKVLAVISRFIRDHAEAQDVAQEAFIKAYRALPNFRGDSAFYTWIYRIAVNTCLTYLKKEKRQAKDELTPNLIENTEEGFADKEKQEQIKALYTCISKLEENERIIITLVMDEVPYPEIAEISGISEGNLRVKIHRIKHKLTELYNQHERL